MCFSHHEQFAKYLLKWEKFVPLFVILALQSFRLQRSSPPWHLFISSFYANFVQKKYRYCAVVPVYINNDFDFVYRKGHHSVARTARHGKHFRPCVYFHISKWSLRAASPSVIWLNAFSRCGIRSAGTVHTAQPHGSLAAGTSCCVLALHRHREISRTFQPWCCNCLLLSQHSSSWLCVFVSRGQGTTQELDGQYSERVQIPAKAIAEFFDRYFHIPLPIVTKHEHGHRNLSSYAHEVIEPVSNSRCSNTSLSSSSSLGLFRRSECYSTTDGTSSWISGRDALLSNQIWSRRVCFLVVLRVCSAAVRKFVRTNCQFHVALPSFPGPRLAGTDVTVSLLSTRK